MNDKEELKKIIYEIVEKEKDKIKVTNKTRPIRRNLRDENIYYISCPMGVETS